MAVSIDIGEEMDIHPRNKPDVGKRLALWALHHEYGRNELAYSGPLYQGHLVEGDRILITFDYAEAGLMAGRKHLMEDAEESSEPLQRFQICGEDRKWEWASAKIVARDQVEVSHPEISNPVAVRYAWSTNPEGANLYNRAGLPASPFTTEK